MPERGELVLVGRGDAGTKLRGELTRSTCFRLSTGAVCGRKNPLFSSGFGQSSGGKYEAMAAAVKGCCIVAPEGTVCDMRGLEVRGAGERFGTE